MSEFALTADPPPYPAPGARLTEWRQLVGRTVRHVCENPLGPRDNSPHDLEAVLIFTDDCWATLFANVDGCGDDAEASINLVEYYGNRETLSAYLSASEMLDVQMVNQGQYELLVQQQDAARLADRAARAARMRQEAERLERLP